MVTLTLPMRWTSTTFWKSSSSILANVLSRRMPALLTRMSTDPNRLTASSTIRCAPARSVTLSWLATATPPAAVISSTTA